jgi:hypothetical protein
MSDWWKDAPIADAGGDDGNWWADAPVADAAAPVAEPVAPERGPFATLLSAVPVVGEGLAGFSDAAKYSGDDPARNAVQGGVGAFFKGLYRDVPQAIGGVQSLITGQDPTETRAYQIGQGMEALIDQDFPVDPSRQGTFVQQVGEGVGQMGSIALGGGPVKSMLMGAGQAGSAGIRDADENDATTAQKKLTFGLNSLLGLSEALPLTQLASRLDKITGGKASGIIREVLQTGTEEAVQEALQTLGENIIARDIAGYDPERARTEGVGRAALVGGTVGGSIGGVSRAGQVAGEAVSPDVPVQSDAERALDAAVERGRAEPTISPTEATIEPDSEPVQQIPARMGKPSVAFDPRGGKTPVRYAIVDIGDLVSSHTDDFEKNPRYPSILQPRDRSRKAAQAWVIDTSTKINPEQLGEGPDAATGSPIIAVNGVVESGNGRVMALRRAYREGLKPAAAYREYLSELGYDISGIATPMLVRIADPSRSDSERIDFTRRANDDPLAKMNATEQATADAQRLVPDDFIIASELPGSPLSDARFVQRLLSRLTSESARGNLIDSKGVLSKEGRRRLEAAMVAYAYGSPKLVEGVIETDDADLRGIGAALTDAAPYWSALRAEAGAGSIDDRVDITDNIRAALDVIVDARAQGRTVKEQLDLAETDMFGDAPEADVRALAGLFVDLDTNRQRSKKKITDALRYYAQEARKTSPQDANALIPDDGNPASRIIEAVINRDQTKELFDVAPPTESAAFKRWAGTKAPVIEPEEINYTDFSKPGPFVMRAFHGTTHDFEAFDASVKGNREGHFGAVNYFTSNVNDASYNYGANGADLTGRIELTAERVEAQIDMAIAGLTDPELIINTVENVIMEDFPDFDIASLNEPDSTAMSEAEDGNTLLVSEHYARQVANTLRGGTEQTLEVFIRSEKPFVVGGDNSPFIEFFDFEKIERDALQTVADDNDVSVEYVEANRDEFEDEIMDARDLEMSGENPLVDAITEVAARYDLDPDDLIQGAYDLVYEGASHSQLEDMMRNGEGWSYLEHPETGDLMGSHVLAEIVEALGFDSIILLNANQRFKAMNMMQGTAHIHVFDSHNTNIKSVNNRGTFDPKDERILYDIEPAPVRNSQAFRRWFGDSKVVDESGKPLVVYHGTNSKIEAFDLKRLGDRDLGFFGSGFYFTPDIYAAQEYAESAAEAGGQANEIAAYVRLSAPFVWVNNYGENSSETKEALAKMGVMDNRDNLSNIYDAQRFNSAVRGKHDGVIVKDDDGEVLEVIAFEPTQIKSVNNRGTFDPKDPRILYDLDDDGGIEAPVAPTETPPRPADPLPQDERGRRRPVPRQTPAGVKPGVQEATKGLHEITSKILDAVGGPARQGRMGRKPQRVRGFFSLDSGSVRLRKSYLAEIETFVHELGHRVDFRDLPAIRQLFRDYPKQLANAAYPGANPTYLLNEGFAELFRSYVTNPEWGRTRSPDAFAALDMALELESPDMRAALIEARELYDALLNAPSAERVASSVVTESGQGPLTRFRNAVKGRGGWTNAVNDFVAGAYTRFIDSDKPLAQLRDALASLPVKRGEDRLELKRSQDPYALARLTKDATNRGLMDIQYGVHPYQSTQPQGASLSAALELALGEKGKNWNPTSFSDFGAYLIARRGVKEWGRYAEGLLRKPPLQHSKADLEAAIADFEAANPTWSDAAAMIHEFAGNMLEKRYQAGLISQTAYDAIQSVDRDYVPFFRDVSDKPGSGKRGKPRDNDGAGDMMRFQGSDRPIINPIESLIEESYRLNSIIARNDVLKALKALAGKAGRGSAEFVEIVPSHDVKVQKVDIIDALSRRLKDSDMEPDLAEAFSDELLELLEDDPMGLNFSMVETQSRGEPILYAYENGKRIPLRLGDGALGAAVFKMFAGLDQNVSGPLVNTVALGSSALRAGITTSPDFIFANFIRDAVASWVLNDEGVIPGVDQVRGMADDLAGAESGRLYALGGGLMGGLQTTALNDGKIQADIAQARKKGMKIRRFASWRGFNRLTEVSETGTRIALFKRYYESARRRGLGEYDAMIDAAYEARDYIDFGRRGSWMTEAARLVPFLNASLQGLDKTGRVGTAEGAIGKVLRPYLQRMLNGEANDADLTASERRAVERGQKMWLKVAALAMPSLALALLYEDDDEYRDLPIYFRSTHWMVRMGPEGSEWMAIPKPFELAVVANAVEAAYNRLVLDDPRAAADFKESLMHTVVPPSSIPGIVVPMELITNYSIHHDRNIVPEYMTGLDPEEQYTEYTSSLGKAIGKAIGQSPAKVDHALGGFGGSWGRNSQSVSNELDPSRPDQGAADLAIVRRFIKDPDRGARSSAGIYDRVARDGRWTGKAVTFKRMLDQNRDQEALDYLRDMERDEAYWSLLNGLPADEVKALVGTKSAADAKRMHPVRRAYDAMSSIGSLSRELTTNTVRIAENDQFSRFPARLRKDYQDRLADLRVAYARNGLIIATQDGFSERDLTPEAPIIAELMRLSPELTAELDRRMGKEKVVSEDEVAIRWDALKSRLDPALPEPQE